MGHLARNSRLLTAIVIALVAAAGVVAVLASAAALPEDALLVEHWNAAGPDAGFTEADPPPPGPSTLSAVTAFGASDVWAVGSSVKTTSKGLRWQPLAEHYNGTSWSPRLLPTPAPKAMADLSAVSGVSPTNIWAVGSLTTATTTPTTRPLVEHYDGTAWKVVPSVPLVGAALTGVTAFPHNVWAVGWVGSTPAKQRFLIERWNGSAWHRVTTPTMRGSSQALLGITLTSDHEMWAVGRYRRDNRVQPLLLHWDGKAWRHAAGPTLTKNAWLSAVTFAGSGTAWAVGQEGRKPFAEHWNGRIWRALSVPSTASFASFSAVVALNPPDLVAVGSQWNGAGSATLAEAWDGSKWQVIPTADRPGNPDRLDGIALVSPLEFWAVGSSVAP